MMEQIFEKISELSLKSDNEKQKVFYKTGILNDDRMFKGCQLNDQFLLTKKNLKNFHTDKKCSLIKGRSLTDEEKQILNSKSEDSNQIEHLVNNEDVSFSLGSSIEVIDQIVSDKINNALGFVKTFKNEKISLESALIKLALEKHKIKRLLVLNWDVKHNLDVQKKFYDNSKVLSISIHHYSNEESDFLNIGSEPNGKGYNINIPLDQTNYGDEEYMAIFCNLVLPVAYEFNTQLILISTSFTAANFSQKFSTNAFEHYLNLLSCLANGKICLLVNEINDSKKLNECTTAALRALCSQPCSRMRALNEPHKNVVKSLLNCVSILRPHWYCLQLLNENDTITLDDHIKEYNQNRNNEIKLKHGETNLNLAESDSNELTDMLESLTLDEEYRTCICSDEAMMSHYDLINPNHPERPDRVKRIVDLLIERELYQMCGKVKSRHATDDELTLCHPQAYINELRQLKHKSISELEEMSRNMNSVYFNSKTFECATLATGSLLSVVDGVCSKKYTNGVAVVRPPGHHANSNSCSGFCFFNSVAVACRYAQKNYKSIKKILILDFDVHHGNGTQEIFEDDDNVLFISLHRYDNGYFYPVNAPSNFSDMGKDKGKGYTVNIPWNQSSAGDGEYVTAFLRVVLPICYQFNPDLVLVSAGFDAALGDPLGGYSITPSGYSQMTKMLGLFANGNSILALEGGYNLTSISESMCNCVSILLGDVCPTITTLNTKPQAFESLRNVVNAQKLYWTCLKFDDKLPQSEFIKKQKKVVKNKPKVETNYSLRSRQVKQNESKENLSDENKENLSDESKDIFDKPDALKPKQPSEAEEISSLINDQTTRNSESDISKDETTKTKSETTDTSVMSATASNTTNSISNTTTEIVEPLIGAVAGTVIDVPLEETCDGAYAASGFDSNIFYTAVAVVPLTYCEHLELIRNQQNDPKMFDAFKPCMKCNDTSENWICLICNRTYCSRFVKGHMAEHYDETRHPMVLSFSDISVWCYECDSYVHNPILDNVKLLAYNSKFKC